MKIRQRGGTFGTVSLGRHTYLSTIPAMNEGNIKAVLTSVNTDPKTKQLIAQYLISRNQNPAPAAAVTSVNSGSATGEKDSIPVAKPTKTGLDNIVENVAEATPKIIKPIADAAPEVVKPIAENTKAAVVSISENIEEGTSTVINGFWWTIAIWGVIIIVILLIVSIIVFFLKKKKIQQTNSNNEIIENSEKQINSVIETTNI